MADSGMDRWFIGGGAEHTPESARRLVYALSGGAQGISRPGDLKVVPLAVPGNGARVVTGSALIKSNYQGGETQTYMGTAYREQQFSTVPTGSSPSTGRSDMVVLRVEDPFAAGSPWDDPAESDIASADYVHVRVISGVPSTARKLTDVPGHANDTAIPLARIDFPPSTGTVTSAMIVDLRSVARPESEMFRHREVAPNTNSDLSSAAGVQWPPVGVWVNVPEWATHVWCTGEVVGAVAVNSAVSGDLWLRFGPTLTTAVTSFNEQGSFGSRITYPVGSKIAIPPALRGTSVQIVPFGKRNGGSGVLRSYWGTQLLLDLLWVQEAV